MKKPMPFDFLLDYLPASVVIKPAIGMFYIYFEGKIVLIFRKVAKNPHHNGIWIAAHREDHNSLKAEVPAVADFDFGEEVFEPNWLQLPDGHDNFEEAAIALCELISRRDKRIGKTTPKAIQLTAPNN
jgi:predicted amidohydrolase YtcJ